MTPLTEIRAVPNAIPRPEYAWRDGPRPPSGVLVQAPETIARMRLAGRTPADALAAVGRHVAPGVTTDELDRIGHEHLVAAGAYPSTLGYRGYPKSLCVSVNDVICHGIPDATALREGDIVSIDIAAFVGGVHGDTCATFCVGEVDEESRRLVALTEQALDLAIAAVAPGLPLNVVGSTIERFARAHGLGVVRDFTGHGIGAEFHNGLTVLHYDEPRLDVELAPGMTFTIEPMLTLGGVSHEIRPDGWTAVTRDGSRCAQFEHTIVVTEGGCDVLTTPSRA